MNDATILRLAELLAEYEGREGPGRPTGKARWLLERLDGVGAPSAAPSGPWRLEDTGDSAPWWMVVTGEGKPPCGSCGREWSGFTRTAFGSAVRLEAEAVRDALNLLAAGAASREERPT